MALHYFNHAADCFLSTNYKVWFSTMEKQEVLRRTDDREVLQNYDRKKTSPSTYRPHYLLVRNPYHRLESFFREKFRKNPARVADDAPHAWQHCQKLFAAPLQFGPESTTQEIRGKLLNFSFGDFIRFLPHVWDLDWHLIPQCYSHFVQWETETKELAFTNYLKVENEEDRSFLTDGLKLKLSIVRNSTKDVNAPVEWNNELLNIVNEIYMDDFRAFRYQVR